jgi:alpha-beta hydrolase superfamily lysophospholipase
MCAESFSAYLGLLIPVSHKLSTPLLVIGGSKDQLITVNEFAQTAKRYGAKLEIIEGGSHDLMLDDDFMKSVEVIHNWIK